MTIGTMTGADLHPQDFVFQAQIQTVRCMSQHALCFPSWDRVLEWLMEEGTFDREAPELRSHSEQYAMGHALVMVNCLLMHIEMLESQVRLFWFQLLWWLGADCFLDRYTWLTVVLSSWSCPPGC